MKALGKILRTVMLVAITTCFGLEVSAQSWVDRKMSEMEDMVRTCVNSNCYDIKIVQKNNPNNVTDHYIEDPVVVNYRDFFLTKFKQYCSDPKRHIDPYHKGHVKVSFLVDSNGMLSNANVIEAGYQKVDRILPILINGNSTALKPGTIDGTPAQFVGIFEMDYDKWSLASVNWTPIFESKEQAE